jgi:hypothetical protein
MEFVTGDTVMAEVVVVGKPHDAAYFARRILLPGGRVRTTFDQPKW